MPYGKMEYAVPVLCGGYGEMKKNNMLARHEAAIAYKLKAEYDAKLDIALQMGLDAATIAANEVLGMGKGRAKDFLTRYIETYNLFARMITEDSKDDPSIDYSTSKIDQRIKSIVGDEVFRPWEERYGK